jgi:hypothetical protein
VTCRGPSLRTRRTSSLKRALASCNSQWSAWRGAVPRREGGRLGGLARDLTDLVIIVRLAQAAMPIQESSKRLADARRNERKLVGADWQYIRAAGIGADDKRPLFLSAPGKTEEVAVTAMHRVDAYRMIQRRAADLGVEVKTGCHTFRATGIRASLEGGGTVETAQAMVAYESPRTTKLYDRTSSQSSRNPFRAGHVFRGAVKGILR